MFFRERLEPILSHRLYTLLFFMAASLIPRLFAWSQLPLDWNTDSYHHWQISYLSLKIGFPRFRMWDINGCECYWGIVPHLVQALLLGVLSTPSILPYRVLNVLLAGVNTYLVYVIGRDNFGWEVGFSAGLLFAVYPVGVVFDIIAMQETLALCFALASIHFFRAHPGWSGLFLALAGQSRNEYWLAAIFFVAAVSVIERFSTEIQAFVFSWLFTTGFFCVLFRAWTGNPVYPLYWSLYNVFGGWTEEGLGRPFLELMLTWASRKLQAWSMKATGLVLLGSFAGLSGASLHMALRRWRSYHVHLFFLDVLAVFSPLFVTYYPNYMKPMLLMLRASTPIAAFGFIVLCFVLFSVGRRFQMGQVLAVSISALMLVTSVLSLGYFIPAYQEFQAAPRIAFALSENVISHYEGGTVVCDYPMLNYMLISRWGVGASRLIGNHYSPHYYGVSDPLEYAWWFKSNNVTLWIDMGGCAYPVWAVAYNNFPGLLVLEEEVYDVKIYRVDQEVLGRILGDATEGTL